MANKLCAEYKLKEVNCLGLWCGRKTFMQRLPYEHYCQKCAKIKSALERNLSKREIILSTGTSLPEGVEIPTEEH